MRKMLIVLKLSLEEKKTFFGVRHSTKIMLYTVIPLSKTKDRLLNTNEMYTDYIINLILKN